MKRIASLLVILLLTIPMESFGAFYPPIPPGPGAPVGTTEGSGIQSGTFTYATGDYITFDSIFITNEPTNTLDPDHDNDWFGVGLFDATGFQVDFLLIGDIVATPAWSTINSGTGVTGPHGDFFTSQTDHYDLSGAGQYFLPAAYAGQSVRFGIGVFDLNNFSEASALLVDDIALRNSSGTILQSWDFDSPADPWSSGGFFYPDGGPAGVFEVLPDTALSGVTKPGTGNYAYFSTFEDQLPIPVPSALILLGSGLIGFVVLKRRGPLGDR